MALSTLRNGDEPVVSQADEGRCREFYATSTNAS
jgi:hypothetical protein